MLSKTLRFGFFNLLPSSRVTSPYKLSYVKASRLSFSITGAFTFIFSFSYLAASSCQSSSVPPKIFNGSGTERLFSFKKSNSSSFNSVEVFVSSSSRGTGIGKLLSSKNFNSSGVNVVSAILLLLSSKFFSKYIYWDVVGLR